MSDPILEILQKTARILPSQSEKEQWMVVPVENIQRELGSIFGRTFSVQETHEWTRKTMMDFVEEITR